MVDSTRAACAVGGRLFEIGQFPVPATDAASGLLRVEVSGVCGSDVKKYAVEDMQPTILGHETVGRIEEIGPLAESAWGARVGDRVLLEEYLPCGYCWYCRSGEFRSCAETEVGVEGAYRYGSTPVSVAPGLWGGYSQYQYLHLRSVLHRVPDELEAPHAAFAIPMSNGIQWALYDGGAKPGHTVLIQGPGQQGIGCVLACRVAGVRQVIVSGLDRDRDRLELAAALGAHHTVNASKEDPVEVVRELTGGAMADVVVDTSGGGWPTLQISLNALRRLGTLVLASGRLSSEGIETATKSVEMIRKRQVTIKGVRGHSFDAVEQALDYMRTKRINLDRVCAQPVPLAEISTALKVAAGQNPADGLHISVDPWM